MHGGKVFISKSKIQFESKSQLCSISYNQVSGCLSVSQRYNLKANHNSSDQTDKSVRGVYQ